MVGINDDVPAAFINSILKPRFGAGALVVGSGVANKQLSKLF